MSLKGYNGPEDVIKLQEWLAIEKQIFIETRVCWNKEGTFPSGKEFILYLSHSGIYCSSKCQQEYQSKKRYELILNGDPSIMRANYNPRSSKKYILEEQNNKCAICGMEPS